MTEYTVTLNLDTNTREYLKGHGYSLYLFKGIDAGSGAVSTVWQTITGSLLYDQEKITIKWNENYYIGETINHLQDGVIVSGLNPYMDQSHIQPVSLGNKYIYEGIKWDKNPQSGSSQDAFFIQNNPEQVHSFYVSQATESDDKNAIVVQEILGSEGTASFKPIQTIALILSDKERKVGAMITQAFSPGAIVTLVGDTSSEISYDKDKGWSGPSSQLHKLRVDASIYQSIRQSHANRLFNAEANSKELLVTNGTLK